MLGKLFKNEFSKTWKIAVLSFGCAVLMCILVAILLTVEGSIGSNATLSAQGDSIFKGVLRVISILGIISIVTIPIAFFVYLCIHFFKTMYSSQGYLTHTLPASPVASFNVKLLVSVIWMLAGIALLTLTVLIIGFICSGASFAELFGREAREAIAEGLRMINIELELILGITVGGIVWIIVLSIVISVFSGFLFIFTALTIGQLSNNHKIGLSIGVGIGINFAQKIIGGIFAVIITVKSLGPNSGIIISPMGNSASGFDASGFFGGVLWASFGLAIGICVIEYVIDVLIVRKHLNLE